MALELDPHVPSPVTLRARGRWTGGVRSEVHIRSFAPFTADFLGGNNEGPTPMEYVVGSLTSCLAVMVQLISQEQNFSFSGLEIEAEGDLDLRGLRGVNGVRSDFTAVRGVIHLESEEPEERLIPLRDEILRRCPMVNLLQAAGTELDLKWNLIRPS